jgi:hypothetical protein
MAVGATSVATFKVTTVFQHVGYRVYYGRRRPEYHGVICYSSAGRQNTVPGNANPPAGRMGHQPVAKDIDTESKFL